MTTNDQYVGLVINLIFAKFISFFLANILLRLVSLIHRFQRACVAYGVPDVDLFQTTDLWDMKNIALVTQTIFAVGRAVRKRL